jgi:hypothetical protein
MTGNTLAATHLPVGGLAARWVFFRKKKLASKGLATSVFLKKKLLPDGGQVYFLFFKKYGI